VQDMLFELIEPIMVIELKKRISEVIRNYEKRVSDAIVDIVDVLDKNEIRITIHFTIRNVQRVFSTTIALQRLR
jgi:predicted component of type VI protein secretion system